MHSSIIVGSEIEGRIDIVLRAVIVLENEPTACSHPYLHSLTKVHKARHGLRPINRNNENVPQGRTLKHLQHGKKRMKEHGTSKAIFGEIKARRNTLQ